MEIIWDAWPKVLERPTEGDVAISNVNSVSFWKFIILDILPCSSGTLRVPWFLFRATECCGIVGSIRIWGRILVDQPRFSYTISQHRSSILITIKESGRGKEDTFGFGGFAVLSNMYFETKACLVAMHKGTPFDQGSKGGKGEGAIVNIKELVDLIGGEFAWSVHAWGVALHTASVEFVVWSLGDSQYLAACLFPCRLECFGRRIHEE